MHKGDFCMIKVNTFPYMSGSVMMQHFLHQTVFFLFLEEPGYETNKQKKLWICQEMKWTLGSISDFVPCDSNNLTAPDLEAH